MAAFMKALWLVAPLALVSSLHAGEAGERALLPPEQPWSGASEARVVPAGDPWITPAEAAGFARTPRYAETMAWLERLDKVSKDVTLLSLGSSPEGRRIVMAVVSKGGAATPAALRATNRPILMAQAGIHAGEIDGKDAGLMLLRELTVRGTRRALLDRVNFLFVPIFNVDGHERFSEFTRINQRGPAEAGWRTTARNLNLNRDYAKLDAPEMRAMVAALDAWAPDLYADLHVTDGADYGYDVTFGWNGRHAHSPAIAGWLDEVLEPAATRDLGEAGHVPGRFVGYIDDKDPTLGVEQWTADARFSNGYGDARHLPTVLVETHSLKPYRQRVLGTYVLLESMLVTLGAEGHTLQRAIAEDRARRPSRVPLSWGPVEPNESNEPKVEILAVSSRVAPSPVSGAPVVSWTGDPLTLRVPLRAHTKPLVSVTRPAAYWIPPAFPEIVERLRLHGVRLEVQAEARERDVEMYRIADATLATRPFEGHVGVSAAKVTSERRRERFPAGSVRVPTDQPLGELAVLLLEPNSPDSFFRWGFFLECLQPTEYAESYIMEPMARAMLEEDPALRAEFEERLRTDAAFAADPAERLRWFYRRTPFFDERAGLYPVAREP